MRKQTHGRSVKKRRNARKSFGTKSIATVFMVAIIAAALIFINPSSRAKVEASTGSVKYITYVVKSGDTLWDIAEENLNDEFPTYDKYIKEVMRANELNTQEIRPDQLLLIPVNESPMMVAEAN